MLILTNLTLENKNVNNMMSIFASKIKEICVE
jgi:hypothetical protein